MKRRWLYTMIAVAVLGGGYAAVGPMQKLGRQTLMLTSADPDVLGWVRSGSMEPVTLTLRTDRFVDGAAFAAGTPADHRISFRVPAAAVNKIYLKEGPSGPQSIGFEIWSRTLDPVAPDRIADSEKCRIGKPCHAEPQDRGSQREREGERPLQIEISNGAHGEARRRFMLESRAGMRSSKPCTIADDTRLGMLVVETPEGMRPGDACSFTGNPGIRTRDGKSFPPKNFIKRAPDGTPLYTVLCHRFSSDPEELNEIGCRLETHFGVWWTEVLFFRLPPAEWDRICRSVIDYLAAHRIEQSAAAAP